MNNQPHFQIEKIISASKPGSGHAPFEIRFIWVGLFFTVFGGLSVGTIAAISSAFHLPMLSYYVTMYQSHGFLQLVAWTGGFILPISLHFIPRFAGVPLKYKKAPSVVFTFFAVSLLFRYVGKLFVPLASTMSEWISLISGVFFFAGISYYIYSILRIMLEAKKKIKRPAFPPVAPFFLMVLAGWGGYAALDVFLSVHMLITDSVVAETIWSRFAVEYFIGFVLFPISFSFAIRTFPLYLRLPAADWPVRKLAIFYAFSTMIYLLPLVPFLQKLNYSVSAATSAVGILLRCCAVIWLIWKLDILTRVQITWLQKYEMETPKERKPTRAGLPDYGEFGRFELPVYAAFSWLFLGVVLQGVNESVFLWNGSRFFADDAIRHIYLLGFITNLILGMAPRMVPAFVGVKFIKKPELVTWSFFLINIATVFRVAPKIVPRTLPVLWNIMYGCSGLLALAAIICTWVLLYKSRRADEYS